MKVNNNMLDDLIQDICPAGNIQHSLRPRKRSYRNKIPSTYPNLDAFMIDSVEESTQLEDKFSDETPKLNFNLEDVIFESGATEDQKSDTAISHDDFNSSIEIVTQCTLEEQCINLVPETPDTNAEVLVDDLEEQSNHIKLDRVAFPLDYPPGLAGEAAKYLFKASALVSGVSDTKYLLHCSSRVH